VVFRTMNNAQPLFPLAFSAGRFGGVAKERLLVGDDVIAEWGKRESCEQERDERDGAIHGSPEK